MTATEQTPLRLHEDAELFREAVRFTAAETGFVPRLIEKDYFCTVILQVLTTAGADLVFKGGTCLAKVHVGFYRLSEDLDFAISTPVAVSRADRRRLASNAKRAVARMGNGPPALRLVTPLTGANDSSQYTAVLGYTSLVGLCEETIKVEVGLREPVLTSVVSAEARTLLLDPISGAPLLSPLPVPCLSREEAIAEKLRAALTRRTAAIRDFYDIDHAVRHLGLHVLEAKMVGLVRRKLAIPGNDEPDVSRDRLAALRRQLASQLKPVLRDRDYAEFDLERSFAAVAELAAVLGDPP